MNFVEDHINESLHPRRIFIAVAIICALVLSPLGFIDTHASLAHASTTAFGTQASSYRIIYKLNGGKQAKNQISTIKKGKAIKAARLKKPTRTRYKFLGWYSNRALTTKATQVKGVANASKRTVYAKWKLTKYNIIYSMNGGLFNGKYVKTIGKNKTLKASKLAKPLRNGYTFAGWYADKKLKTKAKTLLGTANSSKRTVYAKWISNTYSISYELSGGTLPAKYVTAYKTSKGCANLPTPTREGYSFLGWYSDSTLTSIVPSIKTGDYGNKTLYAKWVKRIAIAHRGYHADGAAQNSIGAYEAAAAKGFTYVETDIRFTKDNHAVLSHDATKSVYAKDSDGNATGSPFALDISSVTLEELQNNYLAVIPSGSRIEEESSGNSDVSAATADHGMPDTPRANTVFEILNPLESAVDVHASRLLNSESDSPGVSDPSQTETDEPEGNQEQPTPSETRYRNISEFDEFLDVCKDLNLIPNIELKSGSQEQIESLVAAVDERNMTYSVYWTSFQASLLKYVQAIHPQSSFIVLANEITDSKVKNARLFIAGGGDASIGADASRVTNDLISKCQKYGIPLGVWSLSDELKIADYPQYIRSFTLDSVKAQRVPDIL